jgi:hypothetical protein
MDAGQLCTVVELVRKLTGKHTNRTVRGFFHPNSETNKLSFSNPIDIHFIYVIYLNEIATTG